MAARHVLVDILRGDQTLEKPGPKENLLLQSEEKRIWLRLWNESLEGSDLSKDLEEPDDPRRKKTEACNRSSQDNKQLCQRFGIGDHA